MSERVRHSSFENAMEEAEERILASDEVMEEGEASDQDLPAELLELAEGYPFGPDFVAEFLIDPEEADLDAIVAEIKMMADDKKMDAAILFFKILLIAAETDEQKDSRALADGLVAEEN